MQQKQSNKNVLQLVKRMSSTKGFQLESHKDVSKGGNVFADLTSKVRMPKQFKVEPVPQAIKKVITHLMLEDGHTYKVVITPASLEYFIDSQNCRFVKYLT